MHNLSACHPACHPECNEGTEGLARAERIAVVKRLGPLATLGVTFVSTLRVTL